MIRRKSSKLPKSKLRGKSRKKQSRKKQSNKKKRKSRMSFIKSDFIEYDIKDDNFLKYKFNKLKDLNKQNDLRYRNDEQFVELLKKNKLTEKDIYLYLVWCLNSNKYLIFKEAINILVNNFDIYYNLYYKPTQKDDNILMIAIKNRQQKYIELLYEVEKYYRDLGVKNLCYHMYSHKYLKLIESKSTTDKPVNFFLETWMHESVFEASKQIYPLFQYTDCNKLNNQNCPYKRIKWYSGDARFAPIEFNNITSIVVTIDKTIKKVLENTKNINLSDLYLHIDQIKDYLNIIVSINIGIIDIQNIQKYFDFMLSGEKNIIKEELDKYISFTGASKEICLRFLFEYIEQIHRKYRCRNMIKILNWYNNNSKYKTSINSPTYLSKMIKNNEPFWISTEVVDTLIADNQWLHHVNYDGVSDIFETLAYFAQELESHMSILPDIYTLLKIFTRNYRPYYTYLYFGNEHIINMISFFTEITRDYTIEIDVSNAYNNRCIDLTNVEYTENGNRINKLSGPVKFTKLKGKNIQVRPQEIILFGDYHRSEAGMCTEANFDYFDYYDLYE